MKKIITVLLFIAAHKMAIAQNVGIGTSTPDSSAMLEINSSNKGLLLPRIKDTSSIKNPAKGLLIYNNYDNIPWYYDGNRWQKTIPNAVNTTEALGMDSLWYKVQDSIAYTCYPYVQINTGLGLVPPQAHLQANGNLLIQPKIGYSNTAPTVAQTYTMNNTAVQQNISLTDSVFRVYDPGGTGNYNNNMQGNIQLSSGIQAAGIKVSSVAADFGMGIGDTLWIAYDVFPACRTNYVYFFTNTTINPADFVFSAASGDHVYFIFRSNADGIVGKGFNFSVTRLYNLQSYKKIQTAGPALYFNSSNGSFGAGSATNPGSLHSVALGSHTTASGIYSTAMGRYTTASGNYSTAMGSYVSTNNQAGCFVIGDNSTTTVMNSVLANSFRARFANGYRLYTSADLSTSCFLGAGGNAWSIGSDVHTKENFAAINGEDFLKKIAGLSLTSWNYKTQNPKTFRHYGPMAQDFYAAFGKDKYGTIGNDTTINSADFAGVSFIAIQALEKRTAEYKKENAELKAMLLQLRKEVDALQGIKTAAPGSSN